MLWGIGMTHKEKRKKMDEAIMEIVIPFLRSLNFKGSYPNFRRENNGQLNLLTIQFSLYAPKFVVEISNCPSTGYTTSWGKSLKPSECRVNYMSNRHRIGSKKHNTDYWYDFERTLILGSIFKKRANELLSNWQEGEEWWEQNPFAENMNSPQHSV